MEVIVFMKTKENGETNTCNIQDEERLAEEVQKYPCLYGKRNEGYKEKDRKENTWREGEQRLLNCVLTCSRANVSCVLMCSRASVFFVLTRSSANVFYVLTCSRAIVLSDHVPGVLCLPTCSCAIIR